MPLNAKAITILAISALSSLAAAGGAAARDDVAFAYRPSELQSAGAMHDLYHRMESRAGRACGAGEARAIHEKKFAAKCSARLVQDWVANIDDARLNRHHAQNGAHQFAAAK